ncbi:MAG: hypothetical protein U0T82_18150 [Bacteroidales bacterium]
MRKIQYSKVTCESVFSHFVGAFGIIVLVLFLITCKKEEEKIYITTFSVFQMGMDSVVCYGFNGEPDEWILGAALSEYAKAKIKTRGFCWSKYTNPIINDSFTSQFPTPVKLFSDTLINLEVDITYYLRAYYTTSNSIFYGNQLEFFITHDTALIGKSGE